MKIDIGEVMQKGTGEYERCQRLKEKVICVQPHFCTQRAVLLTESYKQTEHEPAIIRRAKALDNILKKMDIYILEDELIVGHQATRQRSGNVFPEYAVEWIAKEIDTFETRPADKFKVLGEEKKIFMEEIYPYWKGRTLNDRILSLIPEDTKLQRYTGMVFSIGHHEDGGFGHVVIDYERILKRGFKGMKEDILDNLNRLDLAEPDAFGHKLFYDSCLIICDAIIHFAHRYGALAKEMRKHETSVQRKNELLTIALNCERIPEHPAETFWEACQTLWFIQLILQINDNGTSYTPGRFDQFMFPYYQRDLEKGMSKVELQETLEALWVKFTEPVKLFCEADSIINVGQPTGQNIQVGGLDRQGVDATNDLSYRCLEAHIHLQLMQPNFTVRLHENTPEEFLMQTIEAIKPGGGMPQLTTDETFIKALRNIGVSLEDARDYVPVGCMETMPKNAWGRANGGFFNLTKVLELALNNGVCRITGEQIGVKTGDPKTFTSIEDVKQAYQKQMEYSIRHNVILNNLIDMVHEELCPVPLVSMFVDDCVKKGIDVTSGGAKYNWTAVLGIGVANSGDALTAIQKAVFEEKWISMERLINALDNDFADQEVLRQYLLNKVPKYGNDIREADEMVGFTTDVFFDALSQHQTYRGGPFVGSFISISAYVPFGKATGATPDGRKSGTMLADSISPSNGADQNGPTAAMKSATAINHVRCANGLIFNLRFSPGSLSTKEGMHKFASLIRGYVKLGGAQVQFNVVSGETLKKAKKNPQKYRGLVVRVAGYSAFFHELAEDIQDSIITRTEHSV